MVLEYEYSSSGSAPMNVHTQTLPAMIPYRRVSDKDQTQTNISLASERPSQNRNHKEIPIPTQPQQRTDNLVQAFAQTLHANVNKPKLRII